MTEQQITEEQMAEMYETLRSAPADIWMKSDNPSLSIAASVAHQSDFDGFKVFVETEEVPPMELSDEQMQILSGGGLCCVPGLAFWAIKRYVLP